MPYMSHVMTCNTSGDPGNIYMAEIQFWSNLSVPEITAEESVWPDGMM